MMITIPSLMVLYMLCLQQLVCQEYNYVHEDPEFSDEYSIHDIQLENVTVINWIDDVKDANDEDMPSRCRTDLCREITQDEMKQDTPLGTFKWPEIQVGQQVALRCPLSFEHAQFATRSCLADSSESITWVVADVTACPGPPLSELVKNLTAVIQDVDGQRWCMYCGQSELDELAGHYLSVMNRTLQNYLEITLKYRSYRSFAESYRGFLGLVHNLTENYVVNSYRVPSQTLRYFLEMSNILITDFQKDFSDCLQDFGQRFLLTLGVLSAQLSDNVSEFSEIYDILAVVKATTTPAATVSFENPLQNAITTIVQLNASAPLSSVTMSFLKNFDIFKNIVTFPPLLSPKFNFTQIPFLKFKEVEPYGDMVAISIGTTSHTEIEVVFKVLGDPDVLVNAICAKSDTAVMDTAGGNSLYTLWTDSSCFTEYITESSSYTNDTVSLVDTEVYVLCKCLGAGAFAVFQVKPIMLFGASGPDYAYHPGVVFIPRLYEFLGFQYSRQLSIIAYTFNIISLICLSATLISYTVFRRSRGGTATRILLHLCTALLIQTIIMICFGHMATTVATCRIGNILRYYVIFVSIFWNGAEAVNMYFKLVKVYNSDINHFVWKATAICWGVPGLMIGICCAVSRKAFNGFYDIIDDDPMQDLAQCIFRCKFRPAMLYYGYLIPLCLVLLFNMTVFAMVMRILRSQSAHITKANRRSKVKQLIGAVAMLALLGIPWMFSCFGAINSDKALLTFVQGIFQVIFIVFVGLQGLFIFVFHCARNQTIRNSWSSILSTKSTSSVKTSQYRTTLSQVSKGESQHKATFNQESKVESQPGLQIDKEEAV